MQLVKWIATGLLVLPVAELAAFILVASQVGFATAVGLLILISLAGMLVIPTELGLHPTAMDVLFIHQAFPAQFGRLALELTKRYGWRCRFLVKDVTSCPLPSAEMLEKL